MLNVLLRLRLCSLRSSEWGYRCFGFSDVPRWFPAGDCWLLTASGPSAGSIAQLGPPVCPGTGSPPGHHGPAGAGTVSPAQVRSSGSGKSSLVLEWQRIKDLPSSSATATEKRNQCSKMSTNTISAESKKKLKKTDKQQKKER